MENTKQKLTMEQKEYKYFAFISYKSENLKEAWSLKKKLDGYKLPTLLCKQYGKDRKPTREAFLDKTNIRPGDLTDELRENLDNSHYLIVVCSPRSAKSDYVTAEIEWFTRNGRENEMFLFIIESDPKNIEASFNSAIKEAEERWSKRDGEKREILGVNIKEKDVDKMFFLYRWTIIGSWLQRERAYMQLISRLLNLEFEQLWSYQKIRLAEKIIAWVVGSIVIIFLWIVTIMAIIPFSAGIVIKEATYENKNLPSYSGGVMTMYLGEEVLTDTACSEKGMCVFPRIPKHFYNEDVRITFIHRDFISVDTVVELKDMIQFNINRSPEVYGHIHFRIWNSEEEEVVSGCKVTISDKSIQNSSGTFSYSVVSNQEGIVDFIIPIENQRTAYTIESEIEIENSIIYMPCGKDDVVLTKRQEN